METILKKFFGFSSFRPYQKEVIEKVLDGKDCLVVMATGSGKSLCYQVPPLIAGKTGVVVSPLLSLMQDQVMALKQRGISADYMGSTQTDRTVQAQAESGCYSLLFMTPEKALSIPKSFWTKMLKIGISLLAVDEAHCISEWGHNFRVEYKQLDQLRPILPDVPFVSLTATATEKLVQTFGDSWPRGFRLSRSKTEYVGCKFSNMGSREVENITFDGEVVQGSDFFRYLGSIIQKDGELDGECGSHN
ncbi:hypothetical protein KSS87_012648 [Heliosperma pusillum]|nr:hypothetical protein KSS87_012648 [Heliosperma pusillum]